MRLPSKTMVFLGFLVNHLAYIAELMYRIGTLSWVKMDPSLQGDRKNPTRFGDLLEADKMNTDQAFMLAYEHFSVPKLVQRQRPKVRFFLLNTPSG